MATLSPWVRNALARGLPVKDLTPWPAPLCTNLARYAPATAEVLVGNSWMAKCFTHERDYADRYGPADVRSLS